MTGEEILALYRSGDRERAFGELVKSYSERLYWHVRGLTGNHEDTDDLLQDIFVKIWHSLPDFRGDSQLYTWLFRIATNETLNFLRKRSLRATFGLDSPDVTERVTDPDPHFDGDEAQRLLSVAVAKLPPKQRAVFHMRYFEEMPYEQMSQIMGTSVGALKASYHFAYEKVKDYLLRNFPDRF